MYNFITQGSYFLGFKKKPPMRKPKPVAFFFFFLNITCLLILKVKVFKVSINRYLIKNKNTNYFIKKK